jgi:type II secretory pathway pseudopilin PulG
MERDLKFQNYKNTRLQNPQRGYMMITLMLALAMIMLALLAVLPDIRQQVRRDREEELRHRGTAYMRAIQHFYKKFNRYPTRVEELENTNNLRFLRKRYTDPMNVDPVTGKEKDFKFLHQQDINLNNGPVLPGQSGTGAQGAFGGAPGGLPGQGGFGGMQPGGLGGPQGGLGGSGAQPGGLQPTGGGTQTSASGGSGNSSSGNSSSGDAGGDSNAAGSSSSNSGSGFNGPTFGGGPILGVASASKAKTIRVFYDKNHYNDWLFIYLPMADRGGLLTGPMNPGMPAGNLNGGGPGQGGGLPGQGGLGQGLGQGLPPNGGQNQGLQPQTPQTPAPAPQQ